MISAHLEWLLAHHQFDPTPPPPHLPPSPWLHNPLQSAFCSNQNSVTLNIIWSFATVAQQGWIQPLRPHTVHSSFSGNSRLMHLKQRQRPSRSHSPSLDTNGKKSYAKKKKKKKVTGSLSKPQIPLINGRQLITLLQINIFYEASTSEKYEEWFPAHVSLLL